MFIAMISNVSLGKIKGEFKERQQTLSLNNCWRLHRHPQGNSKKVCREGEKAFFLLSKAANGFIFNNSKSQWVFNFEYWCSSVYFINRFTQDKYMKVQNKCLKSTLKAKFLKHLKLKCCFPHLKYIDYKLKSSVWSSEKRCISLLVSWRRC